MSNQLLDRLRSALQPIDAHFEGGRFHGRVTCQCGCVGSWSAAQMPSPPIVRKKIEAKGWVLGKRATCPACQKREKTVNTTAAKPTPAALEIRRLIRTALDDAYDEDKQRYRPGHTDETVAKAVGGGCEAKVIANYREQNYGPLGEPDEAVELRSALANLTSDLARLRGRFDTLCSKNGWKQ